MKRELLFITRAMALVSLAAFAAPTTFDVSGHKVSVEMPTGFKAVTHLVEEVPVTFNGPATGDDQPVLNMVFASDGTEKIQFNAAQENESYKKAREEWLASKGEGAKAIEFFPFAKVEGAKSDVSSIGYRFTMASQEHIERAYYARCGGKMFYFQSRMTPASAKASGAKMDQLVKSFRCE